MDYMILLILINKLRRNILNILHLTDLHYTEESKNRFNKLFECIKNDIRENFNFILDFIVVTGDMINYTEVEKMRDSLTEVLIYLMDIADDCKLSYDKIIIVQGNHEVDRNKYIYSNEEENSENLYKSKSNISRLINEQLSECKNNNILNNNFKHIEDFYYFEKDFYSDYQNIVVSPFQTVFKHEYKGKKIDFVGLNSSWRTPSSNNTDTYGNMLIGIDQLEIGINNIKNSDLKIAVTHFPFSYLNEIERTDIENMAISNFNVVLLGHTHFSQNIMNSHNDGKIETCCLVSSVAASDFGNKNFDSIKYSPGYDILTIDLNTYEIVINHRIYSEKLKSFNPNTIISHNGISQYSLSEYNKRNLISIREILNEQKKEFDDLLISSTIETNAPKCVENIFIDPILTYEHQNVSYDDPLKYYKFEDLLLEKEPVIIFGHRESGKSTLLHNIFAKILHDSLTTNELSLYVNLSNSNCNDIIMLINKSYKIGGKSKIIELIKTYRIVLLIDNLDIKNDEFMNSIKKLLKSNYNIRVIIISSLTLSDKVPLEFYQSSINDFLSLRIRPMTIDKVQNFTQKWLSCERNTNDKLIKKIIDFSQDNYVPTYPIYVSMLLWLSESKNYLSYNNALLVENFVEKLLDKHNHDDIKLNNFSYMDKVSVLISIAYEISNNSENECISKINCFKTITEHLETRKSIFSPDKIYNILLQTGIIIEITEVDITFRYNSIFNYFISLLYKRNKSLLKDVLNGDKLYYEFERIDILTSLDRRRVDIMELVHDKLKENLYEIKSEINIDLTFIDNFFKREFELTPLFDEKLMSPQAKKLKKENDKEKVDKLLVKYEENNEQVTKEIKKLSELSKFERLWILAARLIRNVDDIDDHKYIDMKLKLLDLTIDSSIYFVFLLNYSFFKKYILSEKELESNISKENIKLLVFQFLFSPYSIEFFMQLNIGTKKLLNVFESYKHEYDVGNYEQSLVKEYLINFLLLDNGKNDLSNISDFIGKYNESFINDNIQIKLIHTYHEINDKSSEEGLISLIRKLKYKNKNCDEKKQIDKQLQKLKKAKSTKNKF